MRAATNHTAPDGPTVGVVPVSELSSVKISREGGRADIYLISPNFNVGN